MGLSRRSVIGLAGATVAVGAAGLFRHLLSQRRRPAGLVRDPTGTLDLAPGFRCVVLDRAGFAMTDGHRVPGRPDGMGSFAMPGGLVALLRNHELLPDAADGPVPAGAPAPEHAFDVASKGCVTRLLVDPEALARGEADAVRSSNLVLAGTNYNCAGGTSPFGWLSCEEDVAPGHGFVFLCPADAERVLSAQPLRALGRFRHEAAAFDAASGVTYLTEDRPDGCLYRLVPTRRETPFEGRLEALALEGAAGVDASETAREGTVRSVHWIDVKEPAPDEDVVRTRARAAGAAVFRRLEGATFLGGALVVAATEGGSDALGQIFRLRPTERGGDLELLFESHDEGSLSMPDNLIASPWGDVFIAEDGRRPNGIRCLTRGGQLRTLAVGALSGGEFAGLCFSPRGDVLFANLQTDGLTLAISGPFEAFGA